MGDVGGKSAVGRGNAAVLDPFLFCARTRSSAQRMPAVARWLLGLISSARPRYSTLARGAATAANVSQDSSHSGARTMA